MRKNNKKTKRITDSTADNDSYPFVNPILVTNDMGIVDEQHRFMACQQNNWDIEFIELPFSRHELQTLEFQKLLNSIQDQQEQNLEAYFLKNKVDFRRQIDECSSKDRMKKFLEFRDLFSSDKEYWQQLGNCYKTSDNNFALASKVRSLFVVNKPERHFLMNETERKLFDALPNSLTIFRGMTKDEYDSGQFGISWTLNKDVAEGFANMYIHNYSTNHLKHTVVEMTIDKNEVIAYFTERNEEEIIYLQ